MALELHRPPVRAVVVLGARAALVADRARIDVAGVRRLGDRDVVVVIEIDLVELDMRPRTQRHEQGRRARQPCQAAERRDRHDPLQRLEQQRALPCRDRFCENVALFKYVNDHEVTILRDTDSL